MASFLVLSRNATLSVSSIVEIERPIVMSCPGFWQASVRKVRPELGQNLINASMEVAVSCYWVEVAARGCVLKPIVQPPLLVWPTMARV